MSIDWNEIKKQTQKPKDEKKRRESAGAGYASAEPQISQALRTQQTNETTRPAAEPNIMKAFREADAQNLREGLFALNLGQYAAEQEAQRRFSSSMLLPGKEPDNAWIPTYASALRLLEQPEERDTSLFRATPEDLLWPRDEEEEPALSWANPWGQQSDFDDMLLPQFKTGEQGPWDELLELWESVGKPLSGGAASGTMNMADRSPADLEDMWLRGAEPGEVSVADPEMFDNWMKLQEEPENREAAESLLDKFRDYQERTARQMLLGNYTDDVTLWGTLNQIGLGVLDLDLPMDIRDLTYDLTHLDTTPWWQTALDAVAFVPYVGAVKYVDDFGALAKGAAKYGDEAGELLEGAAKYGDEAYDVIDGVAGGAGDVTKIITKIEYKPSSGVVFKANPDKTTTILGSFDKDMKNIVNEMGNVKSTDFKARKGGFNVLNVPDELYDPDTFWDLYNRPWLDEAINRGDDIVLATKPDGNVLTRIDYSTGEEVLTGFGKEIDYLTQKGYVYDAVTNTMKLR
jgi:hypothetical protein